VAHLFVVDLNSLIALGVGALLSIAATWKRHGHRFVAFASVFLILVGLGLHAASWFKRRFAPSPYVHLSVHCEVGRAGTPGETYVISDWSLHLYDRGNLAYGPFGPAMMGNVYDVTKIPSTSVATCTLHNDYPSPIFGFVGGFAYKLLPTQGHTSFRDMGDTKYPVYIRQRTTGNEPARFQVINALSGGRGLLVAPTLDCTVELPGESAPRPCALPRELNMLPGLEEYPGTLTDKLGRIY
jgi:hypothetical protein